jgi:O-antigen/teichoic acid export membrane protein
MAGQDGIDAAPVGQMAQPRRSLGVNIGANLVGRAYSLGANYLFLPFYINILGVEAFGLIAFYAVLLGVSAIADVGLSATFARQSAREGDPSRLADMLGTSERILFAAVSVFAIAVFTASGWLAEHWFQASGALPAAEMVWPLRLMAVMLVPQMLVTLYSAGLLGLQHQVAANVLQTVLITLRAGMVILVILWRPDLTLFFGWQVGVTVILAIFARVTLLRAMTVKATSPLRFAWPSLRPHLAYAGGLIAITAISTINTQLDKILISRLFSITDFGYYSIASTLAQLPIAVAIPIGVAFFPRLVASVAERDRDLTPIFGDFLRLVAFMSGLASIGLALFAAELLQLWLQTSVAPVLPPLVATLAMGSFLLCINTPPYYLCLARGRSWLVVAVALATLAVSLPCLLLGIRFYGLWGGALAWLFLNSVNLALLAATVELAALGASVSAMLRATVGSALLAALPLLAARWFATSAALGPLAAWGAAAGAGLVAVAAFVAVNRSRLSAFTAGGK